MADLIFRISPDIICGSHTYSRLNTFLKETGERFLLIIDPNIKKIYEGDMEFEYGVDANGMPKADRISG